MTIAQFALELWQATQPIGYLLISIWVIISIDFVEKRFNDRKIKGQEGQVIHPQSQSMDSIQYLYPNQRLSENDGINQPRKMRHMPQDIRV